MSDIKFITTSEITSLIYNNKPNLDDDFSNWNILLDNVIIPINTIVKFNPDIQNIFHGNYREVIILKWGIEDINNIYCDVVFLCDIRKLKYYSENENDIDKLKIINEKS